MHSTSATKQKWLDKGYEYFTLYGPENLNLNKINKEVEFSRASFYHQSRGVFVEELREIHWQIN